MAAADCYVILGISRDATPVEIRKAYKRLARALHPDHAGENAADAFRELRTAYETLSDPEKRRAYDHSRGEGRRVDVRGTGLVAEPIAPLRGDARYRPSFDELRQRYERNFSERDVPKGEHVDGLNLEVVLSPDEAARGLLLPLSVPALQDCPVCGGSGSDWLFPCAFCGERGVVEQTASLRLRIPPRVQPRSVYEISLDAIGVRNFYLRVHVLVDDRLR